MRRRPPLALLVALMIVGMAIAVVLVRSEPARAQGGDAPGTRTDESAREDPLGYVVDLEDLDDPEVIAAGRDLYTVGCVSCHGADGSGVDCPDIREAGAAAAHFQITSGRMPAEKAGNHQAQRKRSPYSDEEIEALIAYVRSFTRGPDIPDVDPARGDLTEGGELFRLNCAACHQAGGAGGALSYGNNAPTLDPVTPVQVASVIKIGPGQMPSFRNFTDHEVDSIARYVMHLQDLESPGGLSLGRVGPIPEGFVAIIVGLGSLVALTVWVGKRRLQPDDQHAPVGAE